jgi:DNA-binding CsgD family transcriptional regulator
MTGLTDKGSARSAVLTDRELQVLKGMAEGKPNAEIGAGLHIAEDTVKTHARRLFKKLGARDRAHAVFLGIGAGFLEFPPDFPDAAGLDIETVVRLARARAVLHSERETRREAPGDCRYARLYDGLVAALDPSRPF